jgi:signal peptidase I
VGTLMNDETSGIKDTVEMRLPSAVDGIDHYSDTPASASQHSARLKRWHGIWTVLSWAGALVAAVIVLGLTASIVVPRAMGWQGMIVLSGSMEPALKTGGLAFMEPISSNELGSIQRGDILTYRLQQGTGLVSHRVVDIIDGPQGRAFITRGDANEENDRETVQAGQVVGKVRFDLPYLGAAVQRLQDRTTYYAFIGIPAALLIATELWNIAREIRKARRGQAPTEGAAP